MKIEQLSIKNVKSFKDKVTVKFDNRFNILIGPNGGGKSNLLDILTVVTRHFFIKSYKINKIREQGSSFLDIHEQRLFRPINNFLEKFNNDQSDSEIEIVYKLTKGDIDNLKSIKKNKNLLEDVLKSKYRNKPINDLDFCESWNFRSIKENKLFKYRIKNNVIINPAANSLEESILIYLNHIELLVILSLDLDNITLKPIFLYFSPYRGVNESDLETNISAENYYDLLVNYFNSTSKNSTSLIKLATNYFGNKMRQFELNPKKGYLELWKNDKEVRLVTKYLEKLNYTWSLKNEESSQNIYSINLTNNGHNFLIQQASSGEKEIINFLLGIFAFNIRHGLIIIDEPELHLHPKWQNALIDLFLSIAGSGGTDNQFILSTHSPMFINNRTVSNTIRVFKNENNASETIYVQYRELGTTRDLLHIVNTHNNQKIFFADKVLLVEGIHDRIVFEKIIQHFGKNATEIIEVVETHSKNNFIKYRKFLNIFNINNFICADRDYLFEKGNSNVKKLFVTDFKGIDKKVIKSKKSQDRNSLSQSLEEAIKNHDLSKLKELWKHITHRIIKFKDPLKSDENIAIELNIDELKNKEQILILRNGEIENYLPDGFKNLDKTLELVKDDKFAKWIKGKNDGKDELIKIAKYVINN